MDFRAFMGNLKTHEMELKAREKQEPQKKSIAFKTSPTDSEDDED